MKKGVTYQASGVDIAKGSRLVEMIKPDAAATMRKEVMNGLGGFAALFDAGFKNYDEPVLVSSTDGVGTKLKIAFMANRHDTIGIDLVAMGVNDIITCGAEPLFFLDYLATGRLNADKGADLIKGIARGCREAGCALIGGETAEMPGIYNDEEYDLAGFVVGVAEKRRIIDGSSVREGDCIIGIASTGLHSNGYSLARHVLFEYLKLHLDERPSGWERTIGEELLLPTMIYVKPVMQITRDFNIHGIAHITGGGLTENLPRVLPSQCKAVIRLGSWPVNPVFRLIEDGGPVAQDEMLRTFNYGIGMALIAEIKDEAELLARLRNRGLNAYSIGVISARHNVEPGVEYINIKH